MQPNNLVSSWLKGRARADGDSIQMAGGNDKDCRSKARRAYRWIIENAIYAPFYDVEYGTPSRLGSREQKLWIPDKDSYASFALLPVLSLLSCQRLLLIGSPGRGKTTIATLISLISGASLTETRQAVQHGHPQMTHADMLGSPLPGDLVKATAGSDIPIAWKKWISMRVKIIDEYNRIPTKTQSCLLSLMAEGYAEMYGQVISSGKSTWFLTANDDSGGGTFPVITALKDRIDAVVRTTPFSAQYLDQLAKRLETAQTPEEVVPKDIVFTPEELTEAEQQIRAVTLPDEVLSNLGFLLGQLDFCLRASNRLEYMNKDTLMLAGKRLGHVCTEDCPLDKSENICSQTENGISTRAYQSIIQYAKALAWFRGNPEVDDEDIRQAMPWVLHDRLRPNSMSGFFLKSENQVYLLDQLSWIRQLQDRANAIRPAYNSIKETVDALRAEVESALPTMNTSALKRTVQRLRAEAEKLLNNHELNGPVHQDLLRLKQLITTCQNQLQRLEQS